MPEKISPSDPIEDPCPDGCGLTLVYSNDLTVHCSICKLKIIPQAPVSENESGRDPIESPKKGAPSKAKKGSKD